MLNNLHAIAVVLYVNWVCYYGYCQRANPFLATYSNEYKRSIEESFELIRKQQKHKLTKCRNIKLKGDYSETQ